MAFRPGAIGDKQGLMMRSSQTLTVLIAVAALAASCGSLHAQEFAIAEAAWSATLDLEELKAKTIAFLDRPSEE